MSGNSSSEKSKINSLIGIRGIACLCIVCFHFNCLMVDDRGLSMDALPFAPASQTFFIYAKNAVELFFLLAGFLSAYNYNTRIADMSFFSYFKKHYLKFLIPSILVNTWAFINNLILTNGLQNPPVSPAPVTPLKYVLSVLMVNTGWFTTKKFSGLPANTTMWYIDILLLCYILYYIVRKLCKNTHVFIVACTIMVVVGWVCLEFYTDIPFFNYLNGRGYAMFFLGVLLIEFQRDADETTRKKVSMVLFTVVVCVFLVKLIVGHEAIFGDISSTSMKYVRYSEFFVFPAILLAALNLSPVKRFFEWKPLVYLGTISAIVYYVHNCMMEDYLIIDSAAGTQVDFSSGWVFLAVLISTVVFAAIVQLIKTRVPRVFKKGA